jgi:mercuric ion transport protein
MRIIILSIVCFGLLLSCNNKSNSTSGNAQFEKIITYHVSGMTCTGCENTIKKQITKMEGVIEVKASFTDSLTIVRFDTTLVSSVAISDEINKLGYTVISYEN